MLSRTFLHVPGVGDRREQDLWRRGYTSWNAFLREYPAGPWRDLVAERLEPGRAARDLPRRAAWRLATAFPGRTAYLDIETTGLGFGPDSITCIGLCDGETVETFVRGRDLHRFPRALERFEAVVTYNGSCFDLPVLQASFPDFDFGERLRHIDLRFPLARLGLKGGLKGVEQALGLSRAPELDGADGYLAVLLWGAHQAGHPNALETLLSYCLEDVVHLIPLLAHVYDRMTAGLPVEPDPYPIPRIPAIPQRPDGGLVRDLLRRFRPPAP